VSTITDLNGKDFAYYWKILNAEQKQQLAEDSKIDYKVLSRIANTGGVGWSTIQTLARVDANITFEMFADTNVFKVAYCLSLSDDPIEIEVVATTAQSASDLVLGMHASPCTIKSVKFVRKFVSEED